jgi:hypothetical protein
MTKKQVVEKHSTLKIKTGLKAGDHCWGAWNSLNPWDDRSIENFVNCCQNDRNCLKGSSSPDYRQKSPSQDYGGMQGLPRKM